MLFNSYVFIFAFLPIVLLAYQFASPQYKKLVLIFSSIFFYSYLIPQNIWLLLASITVNYLFMMKLLKRDAHADKYYKASLCFNLALLAFFKYGASFLPLGISFYTIQQIALLTDAHQGMFEKIDKEDYLLSVIFFPKMIAGPLVRSVDFLQELNNIKSNRFNFDQFNAGLFLFVIGLAKKVLISDYFSDFVHSSFDEKESLHFFSAWASAFSYTFQLYFDFSGYSDMAVGISSMFGIKIPQNFNSPFKSKNIVEFWTRWHISLSQFITSYIFTPILRSMPKMNFKFQMFSVFLAMTLAGVWHGETINFLIYGMMHGLALVICHNFKKKKFKMPSKLSWFITFIFVNFTFIIFRAKDLASALKVYKGMLGLSGFYLPKFGIKILNNLKHIGVQIGSYMTNDENLLFALIVFLFISVMKGKNSTELQTNIKYTHKTAAILSLVFVLCIFGLNRVSEFIYFNF